MRGHAGLTIRFRVESVGSTGEFDIFPRLDSRSVDLALFGVANLFNILMVGIFLARAKGLLRLEHVLGLVAVALILPLGIGVISNAIHARPWWSIVLPVLLILFLILEFLFDYVLRLNFRETSLLWPYLAVYYLGLMGMIGYSFLVGRTFGFVTLATYFLNLLATWYAHTR